MASLWSSFLDATMAFTNIEAMSSWSMTALTGTGGLTGRRANILGFTKQWKNSNGQLGRACLGCVDRTKIRVPIFHVRSRRFELLLLIQMKSGKLHRCTFRRDGNCAIVVDHRKASELRRPYQPEHAKGSRVRIASRLVLEQFLRDWKYHSKLQPEQLNYADQLVEIDAVGFYHGGDKLYKLKGVPGVWHPQCLLPAAKS